MIFQNNSSKKEVSEEIPKNNRKILSKEERTAIVSSQKYANDGIQNLEFNNLQKAIIAFKNAIRELDIFNN